MSNTRGDRAANWIEKFCITPSGPDKEQWVRLSTAQRETIRRIYDAPNGPHGEPVTGVLGAFLALLHVCGPEAPGGSPPCIGLPAPFRGP